MVHMVEGIDHSEDEIEMEDPIIAVQVHHQDLKMTKDLTRESDVVQMIFVNDHYHLLFLHRQNSETDKILDVLHFVHKQVEFERRFKL